MWLWAQEMYFIQTLTVWETLLLHASLRLSRQALKAEGWCPITLTLKEMGLLSRRDCKV